MAKADSNSTPSASDWRTVAKTLPAGADRDMWLSELDRIRRDQLPPEKYVEIFEERAKQSERLIQESPITADRIAELEQDARRCREQAEHHARLIGQPRRFRRHCEILLLWMLRGGGDPLITNRTDEPVVRYFQAATKFVFGEAVSASTAKTNILKFRHLNFSAASLRGEGAMSIDDSKVFVISADGTVKR
jgi:hypothetical protein